MYWPPPFPYPMSQGQSGSSFKEMKAFMKFVKEWEKTSKDEEKKKEEDKKKKEGDKKQKVVSTIEAGFILTLFAPFIGLAYTYFFMWGIERVIQEIQTLAIHGAH